MGIFVLDLLIFIDFILAGKTLTDCSNLVLPNNFKKKNWWYDFKLL